VRLLTHRLQQIQLLVEPFRPQSNSRFYNLGQPFGAMRAPSVGKLYPWPLFIRDKNRMR